MTQRWHQKASVQAAIVNAIPSVVVAIISVVGLCITVRYANKQIRQTQDNYNKQITRDSVLSTSQDSVSRIQTQLAKLQLRLLGKEYDWDSISKSKELTLLKGQYALFRKQDNRTDMINRRNFYISKISWVTYPVPYNYKNLDSVLGYKGEFIYKRDKDVVDSTIYLIHSLMFYNGVFDSYDSLLYNLPLFHTLKQATEILKTRGIENRYSIPGSLFKKYIVLIEFSNNTQLPIKVVKGATIKIETNTPGCEPIVDTVINNRIVYSSDKAYMPVELILPYVFDLNRNVNFLIKFSYADTNNKMYTNTFMFSYNPREKDFTGYD